MRERETWANVYVCVSMRIQLCEQVNEWVNIRVSNKLQENELWLLSMIIVNWQWQRLLWICHMCIIVHTRTHTNMKMRKKTRHNSIIILCVRSYESRYLIFFSVSRFLESHLHTNLSFASCGVVCFMIDSLASFCSKISYKFFCSRCFQKKKLEVFCILFAFLSLCPSLKARQRNDNSEKISYLLYCLEHVVCASTQADLIDFNQLWFFQIAQIESGTNSKWTVSSHNYRFKKVK